MKYLSMILMIGLLSLTACGNDGSATKAEQDKKAVFDGHLNALDKTRNIENVLQKIANQRQQELDNQ